MNYIKKFGGISTTLFLLSTLAVLFGTADIFNINYVFAGNSCTSSGSGDWDNAVTWTRCGGAIPQSDDDVVIQNGHTVTITDTTAYTINSLTIQSTGALTHSVQTDTAAPWVKSAVIDITAGTFTISGTVNLDEKGYNENTNFAGDGYGPGLGLGSNLVDDGAGGGAHAGDGGDGYDSGVAVKSGGSSYDSALSPVEPGSSGGTLRSKKGGAGGGVVKFTVTGGGTFTLDGTITADGGHGEATNTGAHGSGAGAGGSIWLDFNDEGGTLAGSGSITATGGVGGCDSDVHPSCGGFESGGGGGGGGFITILDWSTDSSSYTIDVSGGDGGAGAQSGSDGGDGTLTMNGLPTATSFSPAQTSASAVTFTTTVSDPDSDATSLVIEHSTDNSTWTSSTLGNITFSEEDENTFSSSTGNITSIDTNVDGSVTLTIEWNIGADIPDTDDNDVWLRVVPSDNSGNGSTVTSASFVVDNLAPTAPGSLGVSSTSTTGVVLSFGSVTSESNFAEYKIFYKQGAGDVTTSDTEFSSSTDANLGVINFNGASNATITELATSTKYTFNIWAYDIYDQSTSSTSELTFYTLADQPGTLVASDPAISTIDLTLDGGTNPSSVEYALYESTTGNYVATDNGLDSASPIWKTSSSWSDPTVTGLSTSTIHTFSIIARNGDNFETATTTASALYTLAETADAPTISSPTATTLPITLNVGGNSAGTAYALYNTTDGNYLAADGSDGGSTSVYQATSTWGADFAAIGLTPNTSYQFTATSRNGDGVDAATSTASTATSTLPASPSTPTATVGGQTSITVAWAANDNPAATVYEMYNITNSSIVATTTDLSLVVSGLTAGTSYTFKVRAESSFDSGLYSAYSGSSSAVTTESAPSAEDNPNNSPARFGYLSLLPPEAPADGSPEFLINNGAIDTSEVDVVLSLNSPQAHTMAVSNYSDFVGISLEPYNSSRHWRLLPGSGEKTVYLKLRTAEGGQKVISESINLIFKRFYSSMLASKK